MRTIHPEDFEGYNVPVHTQGALMRYVNNGLAPGGFLTAVITNDLVGAVTRADGQNIQALSDIVLFILNELPASSIGSTGNMEYWTKLVRAEQAK